MPPVQFSIEYAHTTLVWHFRTLLRYPNVLGEFNKICILALHYLMTYASLCRKTWLKKKLTLLKVTKYVSVGTFASLSFLTTCCWIMSDSNSFINVVLQKCFFLFEVLFTWEFGPIAVSSVRLQQQGVQTEQTCAKTLHQRCIWWVNLNNNVKTATWMIFVTYRSFIEGPIWFQAPVLVKECISPSAYSSCLSLISTVAKNRLVIFR